MGDVMKLSSRLQAALYYCSGCESLADVGSDHAYLAIAAVKSVVSKAVAIDNKNGPYQKAVRNVRRHELSNRIRCSLSEGIEDIDEDTDVIAVCGMGGMMIVAILEKGASFIARKKPSLVLQPNNATSAVRQWLDSHDYHVLSETIVEERGQDYDCLHAIPKKQPSQLSPREILHGPVLLKERSEPFIRRLLRMVEVKKKALMEINKERIKEIIRLKEEILDLEDILDDCKTTV